MNLSLWICEDRVETISHLQGALQTLGIHSCPIFTDEASLKDALNSTLEGPDAVLMDIDFDGKPDGFEHANLIWSYFSGLPIIFMSSHTEQYVQQVLLNCPGATGYVMKPVDPNILFRYLEKIEKEKNRVLVLYQKGQKITIPEDLIYFLESDNHQVRIYTKSRIFKVYEKLSAMQTRLSEMFLSCHKSYLVNLNHIVREEKDAFVLKDERVIPISRRCKKEASQRFARHLQTKLGEIL